MHLSQGYVIIWDQLIVVVNAVSMIIFKTSKDFFLTFDIFFAKIQLKHHQKNANE